MSTEKTESLYLLKELIEKFIFPFLVAVTSYILLNRLTVWRERRDKSRLGVAILDALIEEVSNGVRIMEETPNLQNQPTTLLPRKSWNGMTTIPDDILLILLRVSNNVPPKGFVIRDIRIHCKNYFDHMTNTWDNSVTNNQNWQANSLSLINNSKFVEAGNKVLLMLQQAKELLEKNSKKKIPK
jgi:hypothetical protein